MDPVLMKLKDVISGEIHVYQELLVLSQKKRTILIKNALQALEETVNSEEVLLKEVRRREAERMESVDAAAEYLGLSKEGLTFQKIIDALPDDEKDVFTVLRTELKDAVDKLARANALNRTLLKTHMRYITFCMDALTNNLTGLDMYSASGKTYREKISSHTVINQSI